MISKLKYLLFLIAFLFFWSAGGAEETKETDVNQVPEISSKLLLEVDFGKPFEYVIEADNKPLGYSVKGMPVWMVRSGAVLKGNAVEAGTFKLSIAALNLEGVSDFKELTIKVKDRQVPAPSASQVKTPSIK